MKKISALLFLSGFLLSLFADDHAEKPLKGLLVTGGGHHDYGFQQNVIMEGISQRLPVKWTVMFDMDPRESKAKLSKEGWADGYDFVFYNHCFAREDDKAFIDSIVKVHEGGVPAIAMHCAMHSYHIVIRDQKPEEKSWNKLMGVHSHGHGPHVPFDVTKVSEHADHPAIKDMPDKWRTPKGELYFIHKVLDGTKVLAYGDNGPKHKPEKPQACIWVNQYGKGKVFATTIGHHNETVSTKEFLDLITNGVRWATGHI